MALHPLARFLPGLRRIQGEPAPHRQIGGLFCVEYRHDTVEADGLQQARRETAPGHDDQPPTLVAQAPERLEEGQDAVGVQEAAVRQVEGEHRMPQRQEEAELLPQRFHGPRAQLAGAAQDRAELTRQAGQAQLLGTGGQVTSSVDGGRHDLP